MLLQLRVVGAFLVDLASLPLCFGLWLYCLAMVTLKALVCSRVSRFLVALAGVLPTWLRERGRREFTVGPFQAAWLLSQEMRW